MMNYSVQDGHEILKQLGISKEDLNLLIKYKMWKRELEALTRGLNRIGLTPSEFVLLEEIVMSFKRQKNLTLMKSLQDLMKEF